MKNFDKWVFPDHEAHLQKWMSQVGHRVDGRLTYQYGKYEQALQYCRSRRCAIDVGAHVGLWSWFMARDFDRVRSFEPSTVHQECWFKNMESARQNFTMYGVALGASEGRTAIATSTPDSSGDTGIIPDDQMEHRDIIMMPLDRYDWEEIDLIKIDCEGYEANVIEGARATLLANKPCVIVEQKRDMSEKYGLKKLAAVDMLRDLGAVLRAETSGDYILSWD